MTGLSYEQKCIFMLEALFPNQPNLQEKWWNSPNKAFNDVEPKQVFESEPEKVVTYLYRQFSCGYY